ncbi:MAG: T9SS type A sorting domain-containing protein [Bacteroidetes bacterium]|nr:T9SS type A sorting domain-containing protein [Bacteroidota bacterium]
MNFKILLLIFTLAGFVLVTAQPANVLPADKQSDVAQSLTLITWDDFSDGFGNGPYDFEISKNSNFSSIESIPSPVSNSSDLSGITLQYYTTYYWRVRDNDIDGLGGDGSWYNYSFQVIDNYTPTLFSPSNGAADIFNSSVTLTWGLQSRKNFTTYLFPEFQLEYGTDPGLAGAEIISGIKSTSRFIGLDPGLTYYWRISTIKNSIIVAQSVIWSFTTSGEVAVPIISYPKDETTVYSNAPVFYWYTTDFNALHFYEIEYDTDPGFGTALSINNIPGLFSAVPGLTGGTHYYWRVRTKLDNISNWSAWSDPADFYTFDVVDASIPSPAYPTGGVEVYSKFPRLYWVLNGPSLGFTYNIRYGKFLSGNDVDISGTLGSDYWTLDDIASLYVTLYDGITGGETYFWQVQSFNGSTASAWSDYAEFKIYNFSADLIPILSWPIGGNTVYSSDVNFAWHVEGPSLGLTYDLEYNTINDFTGGQFSVNGITENLITITLIPGQNYWWRVKVSSESNWSDIESFVVIGSGGADVPLLNWPIGGATVWNTSQYFSWSVNGNSSGLKYDFDIDNNSDFSSPLADPGLLTAPNHTENGLLAGTTYYWRVRSTDDNGITYSSYSNVEVFSVFAGLSPEAPPTLAAVPILGSPINGVEITSNPTLSFFSPVYSEGEIKYDVEYSQDSQFVNNNVVISDLNEPAYNTNGLSEGKWFWRARARDSEGYKEYSEIGNFILTQVTGVEDNVLNNRFNLEQNYPNPFNPSTTIRFVVPEASNVKLRVFNTLGEQVAELFSGFRNAGTYSINWNAENISSGVYIYRLEVGSTVISKKMTLLK